MAPKPASSIGQLIFKVALIGMVLFAVAAGIGLARRGPPETGSATGKAEKRF